jgi:membrane protein DedA with SNARE-associated domain
VKQLGGERIARVTCALKRNGTLAVFLARKVPAPFTLTNIIIGASTVRYWDFILGTVLGLGVFVVGVAGFGYQLREVWRNPEPRTLGTAALLVAVPLMLALLINHALRKLRGARLEHNQGTA